MIFGSTNCKLASSVNPMVTTCTGGPMHGTFWLSLRMSMKIESIQGKDLVFDSKGEDRYTALMHIYILITNLTMY
jgi:hypothetical protein